MSNNRHLSTTLQNIDLYTWQDLFCFGVAGFTSPMYVIWVICKRSFYEQEWNVADENHELLYDLFYDLADIIAEGSVGIK